MRNLLGAAREAFVWRVCVPGRSAVAAQSMRSWGPRGRGRSPPGVDAHAPRQWLPATPRPPRAFPGAAPRRPLAALLWATGAVRVGGGCEASGPAGRCLGLGFFVRRKGRPGGSGSTRRHFLARSRHRLARSLPPDRD